MTDHEIAQVRRALRACRSAMADLREGMTTIEAELRRLEAVLETADGNGHAASAAVVALRPAAPGPRDLIVDRVEELCQGCEALLQRPLRGDERPVILGWAQLERAGEPVPVAEILELARYLLSRPTPDGTLPSTLRWCESTVQTLSRGPLRSLPSAGRAANRAGRAAELSALYDRLADELDTREVTR